MVASVSQKKTIISCEWALNERALWLLLNFSKHTFLNKITVWLHTPNRLKDGVCALETEQNMQPTQNNSM